MKTQADHVAQDLGTKPATVTDKIIIPGIDILHTRPTDEMIEILVNVMKSRSNIIEFKYVIGKYIEITSLV
jgi:hypothetical protein